MGSSFSKPQQPSATTPDEQQEQINLSSQAWGGPPVVDLTTPEPEPLEPDTVLLTVPLLAALAGFPTGLSKSSSTASRVFLAENAHRAPTTVQGWYFYNKTKNYHVILAAVKGGSKKALIYAGITSAFLFTDVLAGQIRTWLQHRAAGSGSRRPPGDLPFPGYVPTGHGISPHRRKFPPHAEQADSDPASATSNGGTAGMDVDAHMDVDIDRPTYDPDQDIALISSTRVPHSSQLLRTYPWWSKNAAKERSESPLRIADGVVSGSLVTLAMGYTARLGKLTTRRTATFGALAGAAWGLGSLVNSNREKWLPQSPPPPPPLPLPAEPSSTKQQQSE